jgi:hypothetical protein
MKTRRLIEPQNPGPPDRRGARPGCPGLFRGRQGVARPSHLVTRCGSVPSSSVPLRVSTYCRCDASCQSRVLVADGSERHGGDDGVERGLGDRDPDQDNPVTAPPLRLGGSGADPDNRSTAFWRSSSALVSIRASCSRRPACLPFRTIEVTAPRKPGTPIATRSCQSRAQGQESRWSSRRRAGRKQPAIPRTRLW